MPSQSVLQLLLKGQTVYKGLCIGNFDEIFEKMVIYQLIFTIKKCCTCCVIVIKNKIYMKNRFARTCILFSYSQWNYSKIIQRLQQNIICVIEYIFCFAGFFFLITLIQYKLSTDNLYFEKKRLFRCFNLLIKKLLDGAIYQQLWNFDYSTVNTERVWWQSRAKQFLQSNHRWWDVTS